MVPTLTEATGIRGTGNGHMQWNGTVPCMTMVAVVVAEVRMMVRRVLLYLLGCESHVPNIGVRKRRRSTSPYERDSRPRYDDYGRYKLSEDSARHNNVTVISQIPGVPVTNRLGVPRTIVKLRAVHLRIHTPSTILHPSSSMPSGSDSTSHKLRRKRTALIKPPNSKLPTDQNPEMASS
jgi:hypothetical protein